MSSNGKKLKAEFETRVKDCKNEQLKAIKFLGELDSRPDLMKKLILQTLKGKYDSIQYALNNRAYGLFFALLHKVNAVEYFEEHDDLLELAIDAKADRDKRVAAVLKAHEIFEIPFDIQDLPEKQLRKFYEESWSGDVIKLLYDSTDSFFIPRGQNKAKMQALIYYNTFSTQPSKIRKEAAAESIAISKGLRDAGFNVPSAFIDRTRAEFLQELESHLKSLNTKHTSPSIFVLCIMTHGDLGILHDKDGEPMEINEVLRTVRVQLPQHIPFVLLIQSCQGSKEPNQTVTITDPRFDGDDETDAHMHEGLETARACPRVAPIIVQWPETIVVTATPPGFSATRDHFFRHMADQLKLADGKKPFLSLVAKCSNAMSTAGDPSSSAQAPSSQSVLRKDLILPKSLVYDKLTKVQKKGLLRRWAGMANEMMDIIKNSTP